MGAAGYGAYCASKAGVINFAESLRREVLFSRSISVFVACPGDIDTPQYHRETRDMPHWMQARQDASFLERFSSAGHGDDSRNQLQAVGAISAS